MLYSLVPCHKSGSTFVSFLISGFALHDAGPEHKYRNQELDILHIGSWCDRVIIKPNMAYEACQLLNLIWHAKHVN